MTSDEKKAVEEKVNELVSDLACCDRAGCRCWQAVSDLRKIRDYCNEQIMESIHEDLK